VKRLVLALAIALSAVAVLGGARPVAAGEQVPFKGRLDGAVTVAPLAPPLLQVEVEATGNATHLGRFTLEIVDPNDPTKGEVNGTLIVTAANGDKLYADGAGSWEAYVLNGNMFLKRFADVPANMQPTGEGEIDVYPGNGFLEFEVQGPYTQVAANGKIPWSIQWKVVKVPSTVTIAAGSSTLLDFAKQQLGL